MILPDTSVWIDYFNGIQNWQTEALDELLGTELILMGDLILTEILQGLRDDRSFEKVKTLLLRLSYRDMLGKELAIKAAENYRKLRKKGITPRKTIDVWIATFCLENDMTLLQNDRDFDPIEKYLKLKILRNHHSLR